jgi:hypothetical protein
MNDEALQKRNQLATSYLSRLQALAFEISVAMEAISANALSRLQESIAKQEMLCAGLVNMANLVGEEFQTSEPALLPCIDTGVELKIRAASGAIRDLNLQYAALLKHSGKSIALLISLCRSHTGKSQEVRGSRLKHQTWSCEM